MLANKASFGDIGDIRGGEFRGGETEDDVMSKISSLEELSMTFGLNPNNVSELYWNPNFTSEYGIAIYGKMSQENIQYIEVERRYDTMQRRARQNGLKDGEEINLDNQQIIS